MRHEHFVSSEPFDPRSIEALTPAQKNTTWRRNGS